jgi:signal transduction histidine kinase
VQPAAVQIGLHDDVNANDVRATREQLLNQNRRPEYLVESLPVLAEADRGLDSDLQESTSRTSPTTSWRECPRCGRDARTRRPHRASQQSRRARRADDRRQLLVHLFGNAVEYNEPGGFVRVTMRADGFVVANSGPVVPKDVAPVLVEPFRRCADTSSGGRCSGLGRSIVASIVDAHGWQLDVSARANGGLRVDVSSV